MAKQLRSEVAYKYLMDKMLAHELVPGDTVNRRQVADELGMSVAPVLEAMVQLQAEGLLETIPRRETRVRTLRREDMRSAILIRQAFDHQIARLVCGEPVKRIEKKLMAMAKDADASQVDLVEHWKAESLFHIALAELTDCPMFVDEYRKVMRWNLFYALRVLVPRRAAGSTHALLLEALTSGDADKAVGAMERHIAHYDKFLREELSRSRQDRARRSSETPAFDAL